MSVRMRVTRAHTGNRRSHHALKEPRLSKCSKCGAQHLRHRMCPDCGNYRSREVVDVLGNKAKQLQKREEKLRSRGVDTDAEKEVQEESKKEKKTTAKPVKKKVTAKKVVKKNKDETK